MRKSGNYLVRHGSGYKFQMAVPRDLREVIGRRMWRRYLSNMSEQEARLTALQLSLACRREIDRLRRVMRNDGSRPNRPTEPLISRPRAADIRVHASYEIASPEASTVSLTMPLPTSPGPVAAVSRELGRLAPAALSACNDNADGDYPAVLLPTTILAPPGFAESEPCIAPIGDSGLENSQQYCATDDPGLTILELVGLWCEIARPRAQRSRLRMTTCARMLQEVIGPMPAASVSRSDIMRFRDHLETTELSRATARLYLQGVHRLFSVALSEGHVHENPAAGIQLRPGTDKFAGRDRRRPFRQDELRQLFGALHAEPEAFRWIVRLLAYHGMRSGEVVQLHVDDVVPLFGVPVLRVHDLNGSIKNRFSERDIPLHPACLGFLDYAARVGSGRIFAEDEWRADRFQRTAGVFLRRRAHLEDPSVTMHSLRHTWRTLAREVGMPAPVSRAIMGHSMGSDVHEGYGAGPSLKLRAEWMGKIDPFAME